MDSLAAAAVPLHDSIENLAHAVYARIQRVAPDRVALVGVSGIDGSGKSARSRELNDALRALGLRVAHIGIDPWQNPQSVRFGGADPGLHFYSRCIRFEELFAQLVDPLLRHGSINLNTRGIRTDRDEWYDLSYAFEDVDLVLLEGILLFTRELAPRFDLRIWIECSFDTALQRALARNVENLPAAHLRRDYERIYHAAQRHHLSIDTPRASAHLIFDNEEDR